MCNYVNKEVQDCTASHTSLVSGRIQACHTMQLWEVLRIGRTMFYPEADWTFAHELCKSLILKDIQHFRKRKTSGIADAIVGVSQGSADGNQRKAQGRTTNHLTERRHSGKILSSGQSSPSKGNDVKTKPGKFTFKVPDGHPQAGEKIEKAFEYPETETEAEATQVLADKKWNVKEIVDDILKANARSNAYQAALLPYRPSEVAPEDIKERMIRDYIRLGVPEDAARKQVDGLLGNTSGQ